MDNRELWLGATMVELADIGQIGFDEASYGRSLAARLAELVFPAEVGFLLADGHSRLLAVAGSSERAEQLVKYEESTGDGPCVTCYQSGRSVLNEALSHAAFRWPQYAAVARAAGLGSISALPVGRGDQVLGVVSILGAREYLLAGTEIGLAQAIADTAAVAMLQHRAIREAAELTKQLQHALDSRVRIEQAKGAVAARLGVTPEDAFELLRRYARRHGQPLDEVAAQAIRGDLPVPLLIAASDASSSRR